MSHSGYFADQEDMRELVRLLKQGQMLTETAGGVLPEQDDLRRFHDILDLACGPGEWVMALSKASPLLHIVGVDLSQRMIEYAQSLIPAARNQDVQFQAASWLHETRALASSPVRVFSTPSVRRDHPDDGVSQHDIQ